MPEPSERCLQANEWRLPSNGSGSQLSSSRFQMLRSSEGPVRRSWAHNSDLLASVSPEARPIFRIEDIADVAGSDIALTAPLRAIGRRINEVPHVVAALANERLGNLSESFDFEETLLP